ncbi:bifunctional adenosylcobinamide kinase/adenosylcobinamide-phosphate guanylyltransferase [Paenibacillus sp. GSMTC-2017]|uniref:bifunctional adenosylcobinamide kinase/adenosylcobinamide-phosphate guanylyltransferase n=1 Tax=Paenibacillus sp. GSMTC-2017 TaxID=2794350 RepID=UPI0018D92C04|nr:bifunctional adenosylcobinamide kinase/adenosylcobinamide-phosphate guanylyltransferase [Paenibacillus sp. GSMTC-2017]MBH5316497.1 bifunctional adenosylcobinamide kinase/adenosylcobinamide-phosphate guanylyltransferase [Paenibacillus sp. GSMTC-2017]
MAVLVTGGARSGKSRFAESYASRVSGSGIYIASCRPYDDEMKDRIERHREDRLRAGFEWETIEEPFQVAERLDLLKKQFSERSSEVDSGVRGNSSTTPTQIVLLDCLTLWLSNWLLKYEQDDDGATKLREEVDRLIEAIEKFTYPLVIVTNEVGDGIVPAYALGRQFRDEAGRLNQRIAAICERVFLVTAGIPVDLKAIAFRWDDL